MFDEEPEGDPHGECAKEIHDLQAEVKRLMILNQEAFDQRDAALRLNGEALDALHKIWRRVALNTGNDSVYGEIATMAHEAIEKLQQTEQKGCRCECHALAAMFDVRCQRPECVELHKTEKRERPS